MVIGSGPARVPGVDGAIYASPLHNKREGSTMEAFKEYTAVAKAQHPV